MEQCESKVNRRNVIRVYGTELVTLTFLAYSFTAFFSFFWIAFWISNRR